MDTRLYIEYQDAPMNLLLFGPLRGGQFFAHRLKSHSGGFVLGYLVAFFLLGVAGAIWSRSWEMSGKTAMVLVAVPYAVYFLTGCSP